MNKCIFLDRDGVLNEEIGRYVFDIADFIIRPGIVDLLKYFKEKNYLLIVITNQGGISRGQYTHEHVHRCHNYFQQESGNIIDAFYYSPYQTSITASLSSKPGRLMFEKAITKFKIETSQSWMIGDKERDITPAKLLGMKTIKLNEEHEKEESEADYVAYKLEEIRGII